ncbi:MAG: hypothetical protein WBP81_16015, partial [Solirubrobacteraceae bacterium]
MGPDDFVICADAKPSIQARRRIHASAPPGPGGGQLVEHEYERLGAVTYLDAWDVHQGKIMGRTEPKGGIAPFDRLVRQVMTKQPYASANRVFWIVDNGSDHRGKASVRRLQSRWRNLILVQLGRRCERAGDTGDQRGSALSSGSLPVASSRLEAWMSSSRTVS